jgi:hypothetical protein
MKGKSMIKNKDVQYWMGLNYTVILKRKNGFYYSYIPELSLIAKGKDVNEAYKNLEKDKEDYFKKMIEFDDQEAIKEPLGLRARNKLLEELGMFFARTFIIGFIITFFVLGSLPFVNDVLISSRLNRIPSQMKLMADLFAEKLDTMSPKDREQLRQKIRKINLELRPFLDELKAPAEDKNAGKH